jgi:putative addiction module component (TIGR02574 family)
VTQLTSELVAQVRGLSADDKGRLIDLAFEEYDPGTPEERAALKAELTRRWERILAGEEKSLSVDECMARLRAQNEARGR